MTNIKLFLASFIFATFTIINPVPAGDFTIQDSLFVDSIMKSVNDTTAGARMLIMSDSSSMNILFLGNTKDMQSHQALIEAGIKEIRPDSLDVKKDGLTFKMAIDFYTQQYDTSLEMAKKALKSGQVEDLINFTKGFSNVYRLGKFIENHPIYSKLNFPFSKMDKADFYLFVAGDLLYEAYNNLAMNSWTESWAEDLEQSKKSSNDDILKKAVREGLYLIVVNDVSKNIANDLMPFEELFGYGDITLPKGIRYTYVQEVRNQIDHILRIKDEKIFFMEWITGEDYFSKVEEVKESWNEAENCLKSLDQAKIKNLSLQIQKEDQLFSSK